MDILIVPDSHDKPEVDKDRFEWLGNFIVAKQPDIVVNLGDMMDFPSLSFYDVGKRSAEGRRYENDVESGIEANRRLFEPIQNFNKARRKQYSPRYVYLLGNHENRIERAVESDARLEGTLTINDIGLESFGWEVHPYRQIVMIEGIAFSHCFTSGLMDKPIGGVNVARSILTKMHFSSVQGHQHVRAIAWDNQADGKEIFAYVAGCYFEHPEHYVTERAQNAWWRGLTLLKDVENGVVQDWEMYSMKTIKRDYR